MSPRARRTAVGRCALGVAVAVFAYGICSAAFLAGRSYVLQLAGRLPAGRVLELARGAAAAAEAEAVDPTGAPEWQESKQLLLDAIPDSSPEEADEWLKAGGAWTQKSKRFWRKERLQAMPDQAALKDTLDWLKENDLCNQQVLKKFPELVGLTVEDLQSCRKTAPRYLAKDDAFFRAVKVNPDLLGKHYDCLDEHESCQGRCSRCWNT
eukprot:TRINITY_DN9364_c0_g1_i1.p1 TRINITY_DN9364_c0_g1~~TRINITY_DN9364_c0_g1_i1.p1  ORF type:complete len:209 (-),score=62.64 TRINITY_DN9364_c0_g1_i1:382-1008(-)